MRASRVSTRASRVRSMSSSNSSKGCLSAFFGGCGCQILVWLGIGALLGLWTDRNLDFWLTQLKGEVVDVPFWQSMLISMVCGPTVFVLNIIAEIARSAM